MLDRLLVSELIGSGGSMERSVESVEGLYDRRWMADGASEGKF